MILRRMVLIFTIFCFGIVIHAQNQTVDEYCCGLTEYLSPDYHKCVNNHGGNPQAIYYPSMYKDSSKPKHKSILAVDPEIFLPPGTVENVCTTAWLGLCNIEADYQAGWYIAKYGFEWTVENFDWLHHAIVHKPHHHPLGYMSWLPDHPENHIIKTKLREINNAT